MRRRMIVGEEDRDVLAVAPVSDCRCRGRKSSGAERGIPCTEARHGAVSNEERRVTPRVSRQRHHQESSIRGDVVGSRERSDRGAVEIHESGNQGRWPFLLYITTKPPAEPLREIPFCAVDQYIRGVEPRETCN